MAVAGFLPILGWAGKSIKGGTAVYKTTKAVNATTTALDMYKTPKSLQAIKNTEYGIYGLVSANGFSEYLTGKDVLGNELTTSQRNASLSLSLVGILPAAVELTPVLKGVTKEIAQKAHERVVQHTQSARSLVDNWFNGLVSQTDVAMAGGPRLSIHAMSDAHVQKEIHTSFAKVTKGTGKSNLKVQFTKEQLVTKPSYSPAPDKWAKKGGTVKIDEDGTWVYTNKKEQTVRYPEGYPDFTDYAHPTVKPVEIEIASPTNRPMDYKNANIESSLNKNSNPPVPALDKPPAGYIWHHHQDGKTMILVDKDIHSEFTHAGGVSIINGK